MVRLLLICCLLITMNACEEGTGVAGDTDSVSTDSIPDPSFNPRAESDSAARQMNLDTTNSVDSAGAKR